MNMYFYLTQRYPLKKSSIITIIILFFTAIPLFAISPVLPEELHVAALAAIEYINKEEFKSSEEEARRMIHKSPENPAGYFFMAFVLDSWMAKYQSNEKENEFYRYCDLTIQKGEKRLARNPDDSWAKFFMGGADGFKGTYEARFERWITAFRYGWKGVSVLLDLQNAGSDIVDIDFGIGSYDYWRSAMMKVLWWMPGIKDKREIGIAAVKRACNDGVYTKNSARLTLLMILINEERFEDALTIADERVNSYPSSTKFLWARALVYYGLKKYDAAINDFQVVIEKLEHDPQNNHYYTTLGHLYLARMYGAQKKRAKVLAECSSVKGYRYGSSVKKRVDRFLTELHGFQKKYAAMH